MLYLLKLAHIGLVLYILYSNRITYRISKVRVTNHKSLLELPAAASQLAATTRFAGCPSHLIDHRGIIHRMHRDRLQLTYEGEDRGVSRCTEGQISAETFIPYGPSP